MSAQSSRFFMTHYKFEPGYCYHPETGLVARLIGDTLYTVGVDVKYNGDIHLINTLKLAEISNLGLRISFDEQSLTHDAKAAITRS